MKLQSDACNYREKENVGGKLVTKSAYCLSCEKCSESSCDGQADDDHACDRGADVHRQGINNEGQQMRQ